MLRLQLRSLILALGCASLLCVTRSAEAQIISVYGTFSPTHLSKLPTGCATTSIATACSTQYADFWSKGIGGGATFNFLNLHVVKLGLDVRGSTRSGTPGADTAEAGLRLGFKPPLFPLKPYVQGGVGYLNSRTANLSTNSSGTALIGGTYDAKYATVNVHGGVDVPIFPFVDLRVVELGYGKGFSVSGPSFANVNTNNPDIFTVNTGVVVHF